MSAIKEQMAEVIRKQPDDASYEEIMRELAFEQTINRGLDDSRQGRVISNEELKRRIGEYLVRHDAAEILGVFHGAMSIDRYLLRSEAVACPASHHWRCR